MALSLCFPSLKGIIVSSSSVAQRDIVRMNKAICLRMYIIFGEQKVDRTWNIVTSLPVIGIYRKVVLDYLEEWVVACVMGWLVSPKKMCLKTCECDLIRKCSLHRCDQVKMRSFSFEWVFIQWCVLMRRGKFGHKYTHTEAKATSWQRQRLEQCRYKPKNTKYWQQLPEARRKQGGSFPRDFWEHGPADTWFKTSSLQICERINFCDFNPISWWYIFMVVLGN